MTIPVFADPAAQPTAALVEQALGTASGAWQALLDGLAARGIDPEWRYYKDGSQWLIKATKGAKTAAWMQVDRGFGHLTCYFAVRLRQALIDALPPEVVALFAQRETVGKLLPVHVEVRTPADTAAALAVVDCKLRLKERMGGAPSGTVVAEMEGVRGEGCASSTGRAGAVVCHDGVLGAVR